MTLKKIKGKLFLILFAFLNFTFSCNRNNQPNESPPPLVDSSYFNFSIKLPTNRNFPDSAFFNFNIASEEIYLWKQAIYSKVAMCYAFLENSYNANAEFFANQSWIRKYKFNFNSTLYDAYLYSTYTDTSITWEGYYDKDFVEPKLILFGSNSISSKNGFFIFYKNIFSPFPKIKVSWAFEDSKSDTLFFKSFENIDVNDYENYGSSITIYYTNDPQYDIQIQIFKGSSANYVYIQYNSQNLFGRIKYPKIFGDEKWHCWDFNFINCDCPTKK